MQVIEPGGQRCRTEPGGQLALHSGGVRVHVDGALLLPQFRDGEYDAGGVLRLRLGNHGGQHALRLGRAGSGYLFGQRAWLVPHVLDAQLIAVDEVVELRSDGVGESGQDG
ncbi:hypothetical protein F558DRAFT_00028 [Streptomyces sp. AmelKG-A3]|nr:hypothetical protein GA0115247_11812 [Streptomyces sp. PalvLS-984]SDB86441.1 hypothetical protein F558DRAFT_00028 [Streptomyces sp. AmelKG-A3]